ncbi:MAG TPA: hypothetical protein PLE24_01400 [Chitinispirillaceae bacterium]|nr:hypothetical protein [Chitinispirillaceae bacterium]
MKRWRAIRIISLTAITAIMSCGVSQNSLDQASKRIDELKTMGVPDSALSRAKVFLYQAKDAKQRGNSGIAKVAADSLRIHLAKAESMYKDNVNNLLPVIDSMRSVIKMHKANFSGITLKKLDSLMVPVDSLINIKWYLQAHHLLKEIVARLPQFKFDDDRAKELRPRIPGEWTCINETKSKENKAIHAIEKKVFTFRKDGTALLVENKKGQSGPFLKEDWEFRSWGKYDLIGDTIVLLIDRFAAVKQNFERLYVEEENGKKKTVWKKEPQPTYDSLITDGSQDRFITFTDLMEDFKKK